MSTETAKLKARLGTLSNALRDLERLLDPLLARPLPETLSRLDAIQQAKLAALVAYLTHDAVFGPCAFYNTLGC